MNLSNLSHFSHFSHLGKALSHSRAALPASSAIAQPFQNALNASKLSQVRPFNTGSTPMMLSGLQGGVQRGVHSGIQLNKEAYDAMVRPTRVNSMNFVTLTDPGAERCRQLMGKLWDHYTRMNPEVAKIHALFIDRGETVINDHVAFRTFNLPGMDIEAMQQPFLEMGYVESGQYAFYDKNLVARHYEHPDPMLPKIFLSEYLVENASQPVQEAIKALASQVEPDAAANDEFCLSGRHWGTPSKAVYEMLLEESEYAGWVYAFGLCPNHFTISGHDLKTFDSLESINTFIKINGHALNQSGGEIKGSKEDLEQSSTLADKAEIEFAEGKMSIPSVFYEFAYRHPDDQGNLFSQFKADNANKIFESTDTKQA